MEIAEDRSLVIDCVKKTMPIWISSKDLSNYSPCMENELWEKTGFFDGDVEAIDTERRNTMYKRYTVVAGIL